MATKTRAQIIVDWSTGELAHPADVSYELYRQMRRDPTIHLCRWFATAPILAANWAVEGTDEQHMHFIEQQLLPERESLLRTALLCMLDFGWKGYETTFAMGEFEHKPDEGSEEGEREDLMLLDRILALKNDHTYSVWRPSDATFMGLTNNDILTGRTIFIDNRHCLFFNFDDEGLGEYALSTMEIARRAYEAWCDSDEAAGKYDKKMAGSFLVVDYPVGTSPYSRDGGQPVDTDNALIAAEIIKAIRASGAVAIPSAVQDLVSDMQKMAKEWDVRFLDPQSRQSSFVDRQKYLDALKCRAFLIPERALIEGEFGTKAEAGVHASMALMNMQVKHEMLTNYLNQGSHGARGIVNNLLMANFGEEDTAWLKALPLSSQQSELFRDLLTALLSDPGSGPEILDRINSDELLGHLGIPLLEEEDVPQETETPDMVQRVPVPAANGQVVEEDDMEEDEVADGNN